jgi:hypothetical protein
VEDRNKKRNIKTRRRRNSVRRRRMCIKQKPRNRGRKAIRKHGSVSVVSIEYCTENHHSTKGDIK